MKCGMVNIGFPDDKSIAENVFISIIAVLIHEHMINILYSLLLFSISFIGVTPSNHRSVRGATTITDSLHWISTSRGRIYINAYKNDSLTQKLNLVIIIHGDAPFNKPGYQYRMAKIIAEQNKNTIAIGLLRPGYTDPDNNKSDGKRGLTTGDNYGPEIIQGIAEAVQQLKTIYHSRKTVLVGHSGGSAITADIIGLYPDLVNAAVIISCPCNLTSWRKYMGDKQPTVSAWHDSVNSISPNLVVEKISKSMQVYVITGEADDVTPTGLSADYDRQLKKEGIKSNLIRIPKEGHEVSFHDIVFTTVSGLLKN